MIKLMPGRAATLYSAVPDQAPPIATQWVLTLYSADWALIPSKRATAMISCSEAYRVVRPIRTKVAMLSSADSVTINSTAVMDPILSLAEQAANCLAMPECQQTLFSAAFKSQLAKLTSIARPTSFSAGWGQI